MKQPPLVVPILIDSPCNIKSQALFIHTAGNDHGITLNSEFNRIGYCEIILYFLSL